MPSPYLGSILFFGLVFTGHAIAEDDHRQHGVHEHGHAELNIALSGHEFAIELDSPAMNLTGFEHEAHSKQDKKTLSKVVKHLKKPDRWLKLAKAAKCKLEDVDVHSSLMDEEHHDEGDKKHDHEKGHHEDKHKEHAGHDMDDHEDEHEEEHEHAADDHEKDREHDHEHEGAQHADFELSASFHCENPAQLDMIDLAALFKAYPGLEELEVQWISDSRQSSDELNPHKTVLKLK